MKRNAGCAVMIILGMITVKADKAHARSQPDY